MTKLLVCIPVDSSLTCLTMSLGVDVVATVASILAPPYVAVLVLAVARLHQTGAGRSVKQLVSSISPLHTANPCR